MKYLAFLLTLTLFTACGDDSVSSDAELQRLEAARTAQNAAYEGMVAAHDRIMPMMGQVTAAQRAVKEKMETKGLADDHKDLLEAAYEQLEDAEDGMMEWMQNMKPLETLRETMDNDAIITYIREESADITDVETQINTSIATARELVGDHSSHDHSSGAQNHSH